MVCPAHNVYLCSQDECVKARDKKLDKIKKAIVVGNLSDDLADDDGIEPAIASMDPIQVQEAIASLPIEKMESGKPMTIEEMVVAMNGAVIADVPVVTGEDAAFLPSQLDPTHTFSPADAGDFAPPEAEAQSHSSDPDPALCDTTREESLPTPAPPVEAVSPSGGSRTYQKIPPPRKR